MGIDIFIDFLGDMIQLFKSIQQKKILYFFTEVQSYHLLRALVGGGGGMEQVDTQLRTFFL